MSVFMALLSVARETRPSGHGAGARDRVVVLARLADRAARVDGDLDPRAQHAAHADDRDRRRAAGRQARDGGGRLRLAVDRESRVERARVAAPVVADADQVLQPALLVLGGGDVADGQVRARIGLVAQTRGPLRRALELAVLVVPAELDARAVVRGRLERVDALGVDEPGLAGQRLLPGAE